VAVKKADAALKVAQSQLPEAQVEEIVARLMMEQSVAQQPQEPAAPTLDPNVAQADAMQQHDDKMGLEHRKLDEQRAIEAAKLAQQAEACQSGGTGSRSINGQGRLPSLEGQPGYAMGHGLHAQRCGSR
jgi:hypothetical protein